MIAAVAPFLASCASTRSADDVFHGFRAGEEVRLKSKALIYDCGGKNVVPRCLRSASDRSLGGDDEDPYTGNTSFEIVEMDETQGVDAILTSVKVVNRGDGTFYWTTAYEELFEESPVK
jgi:hypothetical protein